jgi:hypothetical protein
VWQWSVPISIGLCAGFRSTFQGLFLFFSGQTGFSVWCFSLELGLSLWGGWSVISGMLWGLPKGTILVRISVLGVGCAASWCVMVLLWPMLVVALRRILCAPAGICQ